jgi:hypothetical protein
MKIAQIGRLVTKGNRAYGAKQIIQSGQFWQGWSRNITREHA